MDILSYAGSIGDSAVSYKGWVPKGNGSKMTADGNHWRGKQLSARVLFTAAGVAQQIWIENDLDALLVDVGDGTLRDILSWGLNPRNIRAILITHGHFDHVGGLYSLLCYMRMIGCTGQLLLATPVGTTEVDTILGTFRERYADSIPFEILRKEVGHLDYVEIAGMIAESHQVVHCGSLVGGRILAQIPAVGYRISSQDETVAITGDTGTDADLESLVKDADLALIEATFGEWFDTTDQLLQKVHLTDEVASKLGGLAKEHILVHRVERID